MTGMTTYGQDGTLREDYLKDTAMPEGFHALEEDWRVLFGWLMSASSGLPLRFGDGRPDGKLSELWENHVLVVLMEMIRKNLGGYVITFVGSLGTSAQREFTAKLAGRCTDWTRRLDRFIRMSHGQSPDSPAMQVAVEIRERIASALPQAQEDTNRNHPTFIDNRNQPYYRMLGALQDIQSRSEEYIARIESGADMDASLALLLTMTRHYCGIAAQFNRRFSDWSTFYRRSILQDSPKEAVQDHILITIEPNKSRVRSTFRLPKGTRFMAGKTTDGDDLLYSLDSRAYVVPAVLHSVQALFSKDNRYHSSSLLTDDNRSARLFAESGASPVALEYGHIVTSRSLVLSEGRRQVRLGFTFAMQDGSAVPDLSDTLDGCNNAFTLEISSEQGWTAHPYTLEYHTEADTLEYVFTIAEDEPAPMPCDKNIHGLASEYPAVRILFADRRHIDTLPDGLCVKKIHLRTVVDGIRTFTLKGDLGDVDPASPFHPFGPLGERGSRLVFGHPETAMKDTVRVFLKGAWIRLPQDSFRDIYRHYDTRKAITDDSFQVACEWQDDDCWRECAGSPLPLFRLTTGGKPDERMAMELDLAGTPEYEAANNLKGLYRLTLTSPEIGFGVNEYYRLFAAAMMHNAREKDKNRIPVPDMPTVPMLADTSFGYESQETFIPGNDSGSRLIMVSETSGCEECANVEGGGLPPFVPKLAVPSLILGFDELGDTSRLRLYFDLRFLLKGGAGSAPAATEKGAMAISYHTHGNGWTRMTQEHILCEETDGLTRSGFIELQLPGHIDGGQMWLMFSFPEGNPPTDTAVEDIRLNCFRVTAENGDGTPLPAGSITAPKEEDGRIRSVSQPMPGYGGRPAETPADANIRGRIRIATRGRAIAPKDYETLVLQRFTDIEKACCVPAAAQDGRTKMVLFPKPAKRNYPLLPLWKLSEVQAYLTPMASPFARIEVVNAVYEPITITFKAVIRSGVPDVGEVRRRLKRCIRRYFCRWYLEGTLPMLGVRYSRDALFSLAGNDECITDPISLTVDGAKKLTLAGSTDEWYTASCAEGVLYVEEIRIELVDRRPGIDELRIGGDFVIG